MQKMSKQLKYYYRHRKARLEYQRQYYQQQKTTKNTTNKTNNEKSYIKNLICGDKPRTSNLPQNNGIYSVFELLNEVLEYRRTGNKDTLLYCTKTTLAKGKKKRRIRIDQDYSEIMAIMGFCRMSDYLDLEVYAKGIKKRKLKRILQRLVNLKWLIRQGRGSFTLYALNPFLEFLLNHDESFWLLLDFAAFKIDFFDLLNLPLVNFAKSGKLAQNIEIDFIETRIGTIKPFFVGFIQIDFILESGQKLTNYLPVNLHGTPVLELQYTKSGKHRTTKYHGIEHYCLPISWKLFDIKECKYFSGFDEQLGKTVYIHFDNSISFLYQQEKVIQFIFVDYWKKALEKWQGYTYLEFRDFDTLRKLFNARFVKGKRRQHLINELGFKHKPLTGRPQRS